MRYKTAFRLALRAIGVLLVAEHAPALFLQLTTLLVQFAEGGLTGLGLSALSGWAFQNVAGAVIGVAIGLYLFMGGKWIVDRAIPSNRPYCHECGYELTGLPVNGTCPECGTPFQRTSVNDQRA